MKKKPSELSFDDLRVRQKAEYKAFVEAGGNPIDFFLSHSEGGPPSAQLGDDSDDGDDGNDEPDTEESRARVASIEAMFDEIERRRAKKDGADAGTPEVSIATLKES